MNVIVIIPFPVTNDIIIDEYNVYKVCKSKLELRKSIREAEKNKEEDNLILSYPYISSNIFDINKNNTEIYISDLYGDLVKINEEKILKYYEDYILEEQYKKYDCKKYPSTNDIKVVVYPTEKNYLNKFFTKGFKFQLMSECFNYFVSNFIEKIDIDKLIKKDSSIFTYIDLFKYLLNEKYTFLGHICEIIEKIEYKSPYDDIFELYDIKDYPSIYTIKKYDTNKSLSKMKILLEKFSINGSKSLKVIENYYFITSNGYKINISKDGDLSIERDLSDGLTSNAKMILD